MFVFIFSLAFFIETHCQFIPYMEVSSIKQVGKDNDCWVLVERFSNSSSQFTMCATRNAKPIFLCRKCVSEFLSVRTAFRAIESNHMKGVNCKKLLDGKDRLQILTRTWASIGGKHGLWAKGFCDACYTQPLNKQSKLRKETADFLKLVAKVDVCFQRFPNAGNESHPADACVSCRQSYNNLNKFYRENIPSYPYIDGVCVDALDTLNRTQKWWGTERYFCTRKIHNDNVVIVVTFFILFSPLVFYLMAGYFGHTAKLRTVAHSDLSRWLDHVDMVQRDPGHGDAVDYEHAYDHEDGWNEHEHGWERERKTSRQRKTSSIVREALLRAGALEKLRADTAEAEAEKRASAELKIQSEAQLQFDLEADGQQDAVAVAVRESGVQVEDEAQADVDVVDLSCVRQVHAQVHVEPQAEVQIGLPEKTFVLAQALANTETETENGVDTFCEAETEPLAQDVDNGNEAEVSAEGGSADSVDSGEHLPCSE